MATALAMANGDKAGGSQSTLASFWSIWDYIFYSDMIEPIPKQRPTLQWTEDGPRGLLVCKSSSWSPPEREPIRIASFDLDHTIIKPQGKRRFSAHEADWTFVFPEVPRRLKQLHEEKFLLVIFTNQNGLDPDAGREGTDEAINLFRAKITDLFIKLGLENLVLIAATRHNLFRKPRTGMWDYLISHLLASRPVDIAASFFVGDAAGRPSAWRPGASKDFAATDRKFALNISLDFHTPEEFFLSHQKAPFELGFVPESAMGNGAEVNSLTQPSEKELVILVGPPASGKTTLYQRRFNPHGHQWINQDTLKSRTRCFEELKKALHSGLSVVIDATNPSPALRAEWISLGRQYGYTVRCVVMQIDYDLAEHLNNLRVLRTGCDKIPPVAYATFRKNFVPPALSEGFDLIEQIAFKPEFDDNEHSILFRQYLH